MPDEPQDSHNPQGEPSEEELEERLRKLIEGIHPNAEEPTPETGLRLSLGDPSLEPPTIEEPPELDELELRLQEIDKRIADAGQTGRASAANFDDDLEAGLKRVESRAAEAKAAQEALRSEAERIGAADGDSARGLGVGLSIAYTIIGVPLLGVLVGWIVDSQLGTNVWKGLGMLIGAVIGIALAFVFLNRTNNVR
jgi:F0F1-type ATP synthase assembly protein I